MLCGSAVYFGAGVWFSNSPTAQNTLWQMLDLGIFGPELDPALSGVPELCGNAYPLRTLSWMNPANFNHTTVGRPIVERCLREPATDAPLFVVGCGHSGTTELITLLNRHPLVHAYLDGPGMEFAVQPNSFESPFTWTHLVRCRPQAFWPHFRPSCCPLFFISF